MRACGASSSRRRSRSSPARQRAVRPSARLGGNYHWIRDQLHLPASQLTDDEKLLELQQLATNFSYGTFFGISYRFGSIFSGVVNPRFGGGGGGGGGFF